MNLRDPAPSTANDDVGTLLAMVGDIPEVNGVRERDGATGRGHGYTTVSALSTRSKGAPPEISMHSAAPGGARRRL